jgi:hypothetical protein
MHLRSGRNLAIPIADKDSSPPKAVPYLVGYINCRDAFIDKFNGYVKENELPENQNFIGNITYCGNLFGLIRDNLSLILSPEFNVSSPFNVSGRFKSIVHENIDQLRKEISIATLEHLLEDEVFDVENIRAAIAKTNIAVEALAKQFENLEKA